MQKMGWASALARSGLLAVVAAGLSAMVSLLLGAVSFFVQARWGGGDARAGFEPNLFLRQVGLPLAAVVFVAVWVVGLWRLRR